MNNCWLSNVLFYMINFSILFTVSFTNCMNGKSKKILHACLSMWLIMNWWNYDNDCQESTTKMKIIMNLQQRWRLSLIDVDGFFLSMAIFHTLDLPLQLVENLQISLGTPAGLPREDSSLSKGNQLSKIWVFLKKSYRDLRTSKNILLCHIY